MATAQPRRRHGDGRPPFRPGFGSTPGAMAAPDAAALLRSLALALEGARRARRPLTLVVLMLPDGAASGDLERAAAIVRRTVRTTDGVWRDGRDGLMVVLADADGPNSEPALARLRLRLRAEGLGAARMGRAAPAPGVPAELLLDLARADARPISHG